MNSIIDSARGLAWWLIPFSVLVVLLGIEVDWMRHSPSLAAPAQAAAMLPAAVVPALLPEYSVTGGMDARRETVERTLFNPTRRPAPVPVQQAAKPQMARGQFALTGTTMVEGKSTAFLREINGGKSRRVHEGDTVNGVLVAEVKTDRVKLTLGDESEELVLRVAANPRPTPAAIAPAPFAPAGVNPAAVNPAGVNPGAPGAPDAGTASLIERRRAARAAAAAAATPPPATPAAPVAAPVVSPPAPGQPAPAGPEWAQVFRNYQQRPPAPVNR